VLLPANLSVSAWAACLQVIKAKLRNALIRPVHDGRQCEFLLLLLRGNFLFFFHVDSFLQRSLPSRESIRNFVAQTIGRCLKDA
jgi:hypothetical protein